MQPTSTKRVAIDQANARLIVTVAVAAAVVVFCVVASKSLISQLVYQNRVIAKKELARDTLKQNIANVESLNASYQEFANAEVNVLGGDPKGKGDRDGENPRIVLDALPSKYDFPALTTSIEKLIKESGYRLSNITGTDEEISQEQNSSSESPKPIELPIEIEAIASPNGGKRLVQLFERSIRPFQFRQLRILEESGHIKITMTGKTYFQPAKSLNVKSEVVK